MDLKEENDRRYRQFEILIECLVRKNVINANEGQAILNDRAPE